MHEPAWYRTIDDFYTMEGVLALAKHLRTWPGGRLVVNVVENPIKCPVAPLEFLMLADWFFHEQGIRERVEIIYATPLPGAFTKPIAARHLGDILDRKGVKVVPEFLLEHVHPGAKLYGCKMSVDMMGLKKEDFSDGVIDVVTAGDFTDMTEGAQIVFI